MKALTITALIVCCSLQSFAKEEMDIQQYIDAYAALAVSEMKSSNIPASVTLAQGILESHFGNSYLAREANNHFGIKCHSSWTGKKVYRDDDRKNECFRKYGHPVQSFRDHSTFLKAPRYAFLFELRKSDYIGWCYGLKEAGYATDKQYPKRLIDLIERYDLTQYDGEQEVMASTTAADHYASADTMDDVADQNSSTGISSGAKSTQRVTVGAGKNATEKPRYTSRNATKSQSRIRKWLGRNKTEPSVLRPEPGMQTKIMQSETFFYNNIKTIVVTEECTPMQIARTYAISVKRLCEYNDFDSNIIIQPQTKVFLQPKRNMGPVTDETIRVSEGQTMETISQYYGIKLKSLYRRNKLRIGAQPAEGELIYLRGKNPRVPKTVNRESLAITNNRFIQTPGERRNGESEITNPTSYSIPEPKVNNNTASSSNTWTPEPTTVETKRSEPTVNTNGSASAYSGTTYSNSTSSGTRTTSPEPAGIIVGSLDDEPTIINGQVVRRRVTRTPSSVVTGSLDDNYTTSNIRVIEDANTTSNIIVLDEESDRGDARIKVYKVKAGDTLWALSKRFNVSVDQIKAASKLRSNSLAIGQTLRIPMN